MTDQAVNDRRTLDSESILDGDEEIDFFIRSVRRLARPLAVCLMYFLSCMVFGGPAWKSMIVAIAVFMLLRLGLGARRLTQAGLVIFFIAGWFWVDILPLQKWTSMAASKIESVFFIATGTPWPPSELPSLAR